MSIIFYIFLCAAEILNAVAICGGKINALSCIVSDGQSAPHAF